jgi:hypothetical protein
VLTRAACTVTTLLVGTLAGAVYWPLVLIKPVAALPPTVPFTDQLTALLEAFATVAVNCTGGSPGRTFDAAGLITTLGVGVVVDSLCVLLPPPQPAIKHKNDETRTNQEIRATDFPLPSTSPKRMETTLAVSTQALNKSCASPQEAGECRGAWHAAHPESSAK